MSSMFGRVGRGRGMSNGEDLDDQRPFRNENDSRNYREGSTAREPYSGYGGARTDHQNDESRRDEGRFSNASRGGTRGRGAMSNTNDRRHDDTGYGPRANGSGGFNNYRQNDHDVERVPRGGGFGSVRGHGGKPQSHLEADRGPPPGSNFDGDRPARGGRGGFDNNDRGPPPGRNFDGGRPARGGGFGPRSGFEDQENQFERPSGRGGGFSAGRGGHQDFDFDYEQPRHASFVPKIREIDEIFKDDDERKDGADLYERDGKVEVIGGPENSLVIDKWDDANFIEPIRNNIRRSNYKQPRNFQKYAIPLIMEGHDIKGQAETGSGKSAAFLLPMIHQLHKSFEEQGGEPRHMQVSALIIEPTRELAKQLYEQAAKFASNTNVKVNFAYGEYNMGVNKRSLMTQGCDILVGTTGRLKHLITEGSVKVNSIQYLVLDEADSLLADNFMDDIIQMTKVDGFPTADERQTLFFSATFDQTIKDLANELCRKKSIMIKSISDNVNTRIQQRIIHVPYSERKDFLVKLLKEDMQTSNGVMPKKLIFVSTKRDADFIATMLCDEGIKAQTVNGDRPQALREEATMGFRKGDYLALIVTNVFSRGMDFTDLKHVINYELPTDRDTYVHRIGRTGRLNVGTATSFFDPMHQADRDLANILIQELENIGQEVPDFVRAAVNPYGSYNYRGSGAQTSGGSGVRYNNDAAPESIDEPEF